MHSSAQIPNAFTNFFQTAYVTRSLERGIEYFTRRHAGLRFTEIKADRLEFTIPDGVAKLRVAVGWVDGLQIEIIEPVSGAIEIYAEGLPAREDAVALHHLGMWIAGGREAWDKFRASIDDERIALEGGRDAMKFIYLNERASLGHHLEYVWMSDAFVDAFPIWRPAALKAAAIG
jgi:hypothetical protein